MDEEFNWLEYSESMDAAAQEDEAQSSRRGLRRFLPRLPGLPGLPSLPRLSRPRLPSLPSLFRRGEHASSQPSAADLLGSQQERPLDDLDERLRALRERSVVTSQPTAPPNQALYDVDDILTSPELQSKPGGVISAAALSRAQQQQVQMLREIVGDPEQSQWAGGRRDLPAFSLGAVPRLLGSALLVLVVCLPFVSSDYAEGELPPAEFHEDRHQPTAFYDLLDNVSRDDTILVAFEYGPTAAGELDLLAELLLRHILAQKAKPLIVSSNPIAIVHAQNILRSINRSLAGADAQLLHGEDYFVLRYLPGGALGLRELSQNFADVVRISARGFPTGLEFETLDEMAEIVLIAESAEAVRNWVEQVLPATGGRRLLLATGYAAQPLAQAYADSMTSVVGPVYGIRDAFTYGEKLANNFGGLLSVDAPVEPEGDPEVVQLPVNVVSDSQVEAPRPTKSQVDAVPATALPQPTATKPPTATPFMTATPRPPTATPLPTDTPAPTATEASIRVVEVISDQSVNIRRGPTTVDEILGLGYKGDMFEVIGANGDSSWYNILLPGGVRAWIAAFLVEERVVTASEFAGAQASASADAPPERVILQLDFSLRLSKNHPRFYQAQPPTSGEGDRPELILSRDRGLEVPRLQAMTLGTLAAILVIVFGNTIYAARGLMRRRDSQGS